MKLMHDDYSLVKSWMQTASHLALKYHAELRMHMKPDHTPVTDVEYRIEEMLIEKIQRAYPGHQILTEENGLLGAMGEYLWIIDPIDGTKPYLRGLPFWGISVGLLHACKPLAGFIIFPAMDEFYWGGEGGAYLNGRRLSLSGDQEFEDELVFLAVASNHHRNYEICYPRLQAYGSTVFHLACLARGLAIGVLTRRINLWDFAGFLPIFRHLGISIDYVSGKALDLSALIQGQKTAEGLLAAPERYLPLLHDCISPKLPRR
jgi:myo-inositol-1(or 4)-monophosphatase